MSCDKSLVVKSRAELSQAELSQAEPSWAKLSQAELSWAEPSWPELTRAEPNWAKPSQAEPKLSPFQVEPKNYLYISVCIYSWALVLIFLSISLNFFLEIKNPKINTTTQDLESDFR